MVKRVRASYPLPNKNFVLLPTRINRKFDYEALKTFGFFDISPLLYAQPSLLKPKVLKAYC